MVSPQAEESEEILQQGVEMAIARREGQVLDDFECVGAARSSSLS